MSLETQRRQRAPLAPDESAALLQAAERGAVTALREWAARGGDLNAATGAGGAGHLGASATPLLCAAAAGHVTAVRSLLACGARDHRSPHAAARNGHGAALEALLESGVLDVDARDEVGHTALDYAAAFGHMSCARQLLRHGARGVGLSSAPTAASLAAAAGHAELAAMLQQLQSQPRQLAQQLVPPPVPWRAPTPPHHHHAAEAALPPSPGLPQPASSRRVAPLPLSSGLDAFLAPAGGAGAALASSARTRLCDWLASLSMLYALPALAAAGFDDVDFLAASGGLSAEEVDALGVTAPGHRRKLLQLYGIARFVRGALPAAAAASSRSAEVERPVSATLGWGGGDAALPVADAAEADGEAAEGEEAAPPSEEAAAAAAVWGAVEDAVAADASEPWLDADEAAGGDAAESW